MRTVFGCATAAPRTSAVRLLPQRKRAHSTGAERAFLGLGARAIQCPGLQPDVSLRHPTKRFPAAAHSAQHSSAMHCNTMALSAPPPVLRGGKVADCSGAPLIRRPSVPPIVLCVTT